MECHVKNNLNPELYCLCYQGPRYPGGVVEDVGVGLTGIGLSVVLVLVAVPGMSLSSDWLHAIAHTQANIKSRYL